MVRHGLLGRLLGRRAEDVEIAPPRQRAAAERHAANLLPVIRELQASGIVSHNAIAKALNDRGVKTARGREWSHVQVGLVLARA